MLSSQQIAKAKSIKLSSNFTLYELIKSSSYPQLVEWPDDETIQHLTDFCNSVLQPLRDKFGAIKVNSCYRNKRLNKAVGGVANSIHQIKVDGEFIGVAADIVPLKKDILEVFDYAAEMPGTKTVIIYRKPCVTRTPFIHVDNRNTSNTKSKLEKVRANTYVNYVK